MSEEYKQPDNCPDPKGRCPMYSPDFIKKLNSLEEEMKESRRYRHERNQAYVEVIDELRLNMYEHDEQLRELKTMHKEVIDALRGVMGRKGLIEENEDQEHRIKELEDWKRDIKAFIAGGLAICSLVSAGLTAFVTFLIHYFKG